MTSRPEQHGLLYEPHEKPPPALTFGLGLQYALLSLSGTILIPTVIFRAAGEPEARLIWAVFASIVICGLITALHAFPLRRIGAGYVLITAGTSTAIAVSVGALQAGGIALLASLVIVSSLIQFALSFKLSLFRRLLTPTVAGLVLMLVPLTVMPVVFAALDEPFAASGTAPVAVPALVTFLAMGGVMVKGSPKLRAWAPVIGIAAGSSAAALFGLYDVQHIVEASWIGIPGERPDLEFGWSPSFLPMLPGFVLVFLICSVRSISGSIAIQSVSWRNRRAVDFRPAQGAVAADAVSNLLAGLAGTVPNGVRVTTVSLTQMTGVAARRVGVAFGLTLATLAFFPKVLALVLAAPGSVFAGYITVISATIFALGMKMVVSDGLDRRQILVVGVSFWIGAGCQFGFIFPEVLPNLAGGLLNNGLTAGGLTAIALTTLMELTKPRRKKLESEFSVTSLPSIREFVREFASENGWEADILHRLEAASEETLLTLLRDDEEGETQRRRLLIKAYQAGKDAVLEFIAAGGEENIEDRIALLGEGSTNDSAEREVSLRLLRHLASEVRHRQYHDVDIIMVRIAI